MTKGRQKLRKHNDKTMAKGKNKLLDDPKQSKLTFGKKDGSKLSDSGSQSESDGVAKLPEELRDLYEHPQSADNIFDSEWDLRRLKLTAEAFDDCCGNSLWEYWNDADYNKDWSFFCSKYDAVFIDPPNKKTFEEFAADLMERVDHDLTRLDDLVNRLLDYTKMADEGSPQFTSDWQIREFLFGISNNDPLIMLGLDDDLHPGKLHNSYWDKSTSSNPELILKNRPLTALFLLTTAKFDFPWAAHDENTLAEVWQELQEEEAMFQARKRERARNLILKNNKKASGQIEKPPAGKPTTAAAVIEESPLKDSQSQKTANPSKDPPQRPKKNRTVGFGRPNNKATTSSTKKQKSKPKPKPTPPTKPTAKDSSTPPKFAPQTYKEAAQLPPEVLTDEQLMTKLVQTDLDGLTWESVTIFNIVASVSWKGSANEPNVLIEDRMASRVRRAIAKAMRDSPHNLALLPIDDYAYKLASSSIKTATALESLITNWETLKPFIDCSGVSNGHWFHKNPEHARPRTLRVRIRFGFNCPMDVMRPYLNYVFQLQADGSCHDSVLPAFGKIMIPGCFPYYPIETNTRELAKFIMRELDWNIPIGLVLKWPADPGQAADRKWVLGDDPRYWHVATSWEHGAYVSDRMSEIFSLVHNVPKHHYPWGSPCQYIHDAKMARQGYLNLPSQSESVKSAIGRQLDTAKAFLAIAETIRCPHKLTGMFNQALLSQFGEEDEDGNRVPQSLLKVLWSIKCTPDQAKKAKKAEEAAVAKAPTPADGEVSDADTAEPSTITASTSSYGKRQLTEKEIQMRKKAQSKLLARDLARLIPSALFTHIVPSDETGFWLFIVRKKYAALARQVLKDLVAFLIYHLMEETIEAEDAIFRKWMDMTAVNASRARGMVWDPARLMALSEADETANMDLDRGLDFLDDFDVDPTDIDFNGVLELDLEMADVKAIDEGATILGVLNESRRLQTAQQKILETQAAIVDERAKNASLQAQLDAANAQLASRQSNDTSDDMSASTPRDSTAAGEETNMDEDGSAQGRGGTSASRP